MAGHVLVGDGLFVLDRRAVTAEMAWLLGKALGTTPELWTSLETAYQMKAIDVDAMPQVLALA